MGGAPDRAGNATLTGSDDTFAGDCAAGSTLADVDAQLIAQRIFPGDFTGTTYDPTTCTTTPAAPDGGQPPDGAPTRDGAGD